MNDKPVSTAKATSRGVAAFLDAMAKTPAVKVAGGTGRLIFALDATMSRQPTWKMARALQGEMFDAAAGARGGLQVQLVSYRGVGAFDVRPWRADAAALKAAMAGYDCRGGFTQIERVLAHAAAETARQSVHALVFVGDAVEEAFDVLAGAAGRLGLLGVPAFMFQEGADPKAERAFREVARLTRGAYCAFDEGSAAMLRELLRAVAIFASGGLTALDRHARDGGAAVKLLARQMGGAR